MRPHPIFFSFDENYCHTAAVAFCSLVHTAATGTCYSLYVLHRDISPASQRRLRGVVESRGNATVSFIDASAYFPGLDFEGTFFNLGEPGVVTFTQETLYRCMADLVPEFSEYDAILYSDVDVCFADDISDLFALDLSGVYLAACRQPAFLLHQIDHFPPEKRAHYFAGGLWMLNLLKLREEGIGRKALELIKAPPFRLKWNDQDVMNYLCNSHVARISYRYMSIPNWRPDLCEAGFVDEYYPDGELDDAMHRPKIVHFAYLKPWNAKVPGGEIWHYWHRKSRWSDSSRACAEPSPELDAKVLGIRVPGFLASVTRRGQHWVIKLFGGLARIKLGV